jgi:hypothetical protein
MSHLGHKQSLRLLARGPTIVAWPRDDELRELAELSFDINPATMLFDNDVGGCRETQPGSFSVRVGGDKGYKGLAPNGRIEAVGN